MRTQMSFNTWFREQMWINISTHLGKKFQYNTSPISHVWCPCTEISFVFADHQWKAIANSTYFQTDTSLKDSHQLEKLTSAVTHISALLVDFHPSLPHNSLTETKIKKNIYIHTLNLFPSQISFISFPKASTVKPRKQYEVG